MKQGLCQTIFLFAFSSSQCDADGMHGLLRKMRIEEDSNAYVRGLAHDSGLDDVEDRNLNDIDELTTFWGERILTMQSLGTPAPSPSPTILADDPSLSPSGQPSLTPSGQPSVAPSGQPTPAPTDQPSLAPTGQPTPETSDPPTIAPIMQPLTDAPSAAPTPRFDFSGILSLQASFGVCAVNSTNGIGCARTSSGAAGNPNDIVNCFDVKALGGSAPFSLDAVRFWIGTSVALPADLLVRAWTSVDGRPGTVLHEQALVGFLPGMNMFNLTNPPEIQSDTFCVGVASEDTSSGLRIQNEADLGGGFQSFILSPRCGVDEFQTLSNLTFSGSFCIEAFVSS
jgi:hypothetical protein